LSTTKCTGVPRSPQAYVAKVSSNENFVAPFVEAFVELALYFDKGRDKGWDEDLDFGLATAFNQGANRG
jgi:hypothetical protein